MLRTLLPSPQYIFTVFLHFSSSGETVYKKRFTVLKCSSEIQPAQRKSAMKRSPKGGLKYKCFRSRISQQWFFSLTRQAAPPMSCQCSPRVRLPLSAHLPLRCHHQTATKSHGSSQWWYNVHGLDHCQKERIGDLVLLCLPRQDHCSTTSF